MYAETTSELRLALCAEICHATEHGGLEAKAALAAALDSTPFQAMVDDDLIDMAYNYASAARVTQIVAVKSPFRVEVRGEYLCPDCLDSHVLVNGDGRWYRCPRCNVPPVKEPEPEKVST